MHLARTHSAAMGMYMVDMDMVDIWIHGHHGQHVWTWTWTCTHAVFSTDMMDTDCQDRVMDYARIDCQCHVRTVKMDIAHRSCHR